VSITAADWQAVKSGTPDNITGVSFCSPDTGHFVTHGGQLGVTFDGGQSWLLLPVAPGAILEDVHFVNRDTGIVCGRNGAIFTTSNGGRSWTDRSLDDSQPWLLSAHMSDGRTAVVGGMTREEGSPLRGLSVFTNDGGKNWQEQESRGLAYGDLFARDNGDLYLQSWGLLHLSKDGGETWRTTELGDGKPGRATAITGSTGILVGNNGMCHVSTDNGKSWTPSAVRDDGHLTSVVMKNEDVAYIGGTNAVLLATDDAGSTWKSQVLPVPFDIFDMAIAGDHVIAVGAGGNIVRAKLD